MLALSGGLLDKLRLALCRVLYWLLQTALILGRVVEFEASKGEVWFDTTDTSKDLISVLLPLLDRLYFLSFRL